jgi:UDP-glucose 4-epimerase
MIAGKRFALVGGAGMIGSHVVDLLVQGGAGRVVVFDDFSRGSRRNLEQSAGASSVEIIEGDVRDAAAVRKVVDGADAVFHLAAIRINRCELEPRLAFEILGEGMFNVADAAATSGVGRVVFSSSASVYGHAEHIPTPEHEHPYNNRTIYGALKLCGEGVLRAFNETTGLAYVALRYFNVYGPRMDTEGRYTEVMIRWMERIERGEPIVVHGDGSQTMDFVFVEDAARANVMAATCDASDVTVNVGTGVPTSLLELARSLSTVMGRPAEITFAESDRKVQVPARQADTAAAERVLGFRATVGLEDGLARLVRWWRAQRPGP